MKKQVLSFTVVLLLAAACSPAAQTQPATVPLEPQFLATVTAELSTQPVPTETLVPGTQPATNCASEDINKMADAIAKDYPFTSREEVIKWFCEGADLEDILIALATEDETGTPAEDMLAMRADGLEWDEIWQTVGLSE